MIISVSRRCDIPRFSFGWFLEQLDAGYVDVRNPFNASQTRRVSLLPSSSFIKEPERIARESAELFAFWTRDPASIVEHAENLEKRGYPFFVMTSLTSYPPLLEPDMPAAAEVISSMRRLAEKISPARVIWRYDPVFLSNVTDYEFHRRNFAGLAAQLNGAVKRVIVSVYDEYPRAEKRLAALEQSRPSASPVFKRLPHYESASGERQLLPALCEMLFDLARIAKTEGMEIQSCAEELLSPYALSDNCGIKAGACIDGEYITKVFSLKAPARDRSQRPYCLCAQSVDIGSYGSCPAGCVYCYGR